MGAHGARVPLLLLPLLLLLASRSPGCLALWQGWQGLSFRNLWAGRQEQQQQQQRAPALVQQPNKSSSSSSRRSERLQRSIAAAPNYTALGCSRYDATYGQIDSDLQIHRLMGASLNTTRYAAATVGTPSKRGMAVGFFGGRAYLLTPTDFPGLLHHGKLHVAYMRMLLHVEACFGEQLPDVAFIINTADTPRHVSPRVVNASSPPPRLPPLHKAGRPFEPGPYPIAGIGKSDHYPDLLLVPNFHFHMKLYDSTLLASIPSYNEGTPWERKKDILFGRFSIYRTNRNQADPYTLKMGRGGEMICLNGNTSCPIREHFLEQLAYKDTARMDVSSGRRVTMQEHTQFKFLLNLDGQGISSRLEQLLPLGSLVLKQQSGYYAYYYRTLLKHRVNVLEFWREVPEEVYGEMDWAAEHDAEARAIAAAGQRTAATYLTGNGRTCYWYRLLHGLRSTLSYKPKLAHWPEAQLLREVVEELPAAPGGRELYDEPWMP